MGKRKLQKKNERRVAIVGTGLGYHLAPKKGEVWVTNDLGIYIYSTMIWDIHDFNWTVEENLENYIHWKNVEPEEKTRARVKYRQKRWELIKRHCNETDKPLMSTTKYDDVPSSRVFPLQDVAKRLGSYFFTSTMAYMLAYAIYVNYKYIDMYGCNVETGTEWAYQRDCISYWIGYARGKGIKVTISGTALRPLRIHHRIDRKLYSYDFSQPETGIKRVQELNYLGQLLEATTWDEGPQS